MELDLSSERPEEMPSHHEEQPQVFNNDLFQLHSDNEIPPHHQNDIQDPSPIYHDSRKNLTDRDEADNLKWLESEMTQKDTLDLNYPAEVGSHHFTGSSQQPGRLEDILREADYALRRSTDLANKVTQDAKKFPPAPSSNYQYTTTTTSADGTAKTTSTSSYTSYKYTNMFRQENPEPQENNFAQNTPFDDDYQYQGDQHAEEPLRASRSDSRPLTNSRVAYNLFPIQEDAEQGHETPRDRERSNSNAFEQVKVETQTYNLDQHYPHQNLAEAVLNNGHQHYQPEPAKGLESKTIKEEVLRHSRESTAFDTTPATNNYAYYETTVRTTTTTPIGNIDKRIDDILKKHFGEGSENSNLRLSNPSIRPPALNQKYSTASAANYQSPFSSEFTSPAQANSALQIREYSITSPNTQQNQQLKSSGYVPNIMLTSPGNPLVNLASPTSSVLSKERRAEIERELSQGQFKTLTSPLSPERKAEIERELSLGHHKALVSPLSQERKAEIERELSQKQQQSYQYTYTPQAQVPVFEAPKSRISHDLFARPAESITLKKSSNFAEPTTTYAHAPHSMYASDIIPRNYWNETPSTTTEALKKTDKKFTSSLVQKYCNPFFQQNTDVSQRAMTSPGRYEETRYSPSGTYSKVEVFQELVPEPSNEYDYQHEKPQSPHTYRSHDSHRSKEIIYSNIESAEPKFVPSPKNVSPQISMTPQSYGSPGVKDFDAHYAPRHHGPSPQTLAFKAQTLQDDFTSPKRENSPQQIAFKAHSLQDDFTSPQKMNSPGDMKLEYQSNFESGAKNDFIDFDEPFDEEDYPAGSPPYGKAVGGDIHTRDHHHNRTPENLEEELENANLRFDAQDSHKKVFHSPFSWKQEDHYVDFASTPDRNSEQNLTAEKHAEIPVDPLVSGHETTPDRRMKKLTLKNRNSEERTHEKKNSEVHEDILEERADKHNIRSVPEIKQRHKIFENKVFEQDKQLQEEVFNSQRILQEMEKEQKDSEKHRKIIFGEMPQRKGKDLEILLDPLQTSDISPINGGARTSKTEENYSAPINSDRFPQQQPPKPQFDLKINNKSEETITDSLGRINSERFPYQLKNGVLDPTESFFDFEHENFATTDNSIRRTINKSSMNSIPSLEAKTQVFQEPPDTIAPAPTSKRTKKRKDLHGQIWIIQEPSAFQPGVGLNHQTFKEHLVKVPLITHCFRKFHDRTQNFPNNDN